MNHVAAYDLITAELAAHRSLPHDELRQLIGPSTSRLVHRDGVDYNVTTSVRWRTQLSDDIVVKVFIGPADWGSPHDELNDSAVIKRDGAIISE